MTWFAKGTKIETMHVKELESHLIYTPIYEKYTSLKPHLDAHESKAFFVIRDPRDLLVSWYFSNLSAHPETDGISKIRRDLLDMNKEQGMLHVLEDFHRISDIVDDWLQHAGEDPRIKIVRFEDLTGPYCLRAWEDLFVHLDIDLHGQLLARLLQYYSFENITGGRKKGTEDATHKYRKGEAGDWVNHFTPAISAAMEKHYGDVVGRWGYA